MTAKIDDHLHYLQKINCSIDNYGSDYFSADWELTSFSVKWYHQSSVATHVATHD
jgi:hypothetical protein